MNISQNFERVSVVVVTFNGEAWIEACLTSLQRSAHPLEIIVIDNASTDKTIQIIKKDFPDVKLFVNDNNFGFGQANNVGISYAVKNNAEFIFLLNQDATIEIDTIKKLIDNLHKHPNYSLLSPLHYNGSGNDLDKGFERYVEETYGKEELSSWKTTLTDKIYEVSFVNAAAWLIRVSAIKTIGGFAPLFFHYGEDRDFINRFHFFSLRLGVVPSAKIYHFRELRSMEIKSWSYSKMLRYYYVGCLTRAANINLSFIGGLMDGFFWCLKEIMMLSVGGVVKAPFIFLHIFFKMVFSSLKIIRHRRTVKNPSPYQFLSCA